MVPSQWGCQWSADLRWNCSTRSITTDGGLSGTINVQVFPQGDNIDFLTLSLPIGGNCVAVTENPLVLTPNPTCGL